MKVEVKEEIKLLIEVLDVLGRTYCVMGSKEDAKNSRVKFLILEKIEKILSEDK